MRIVWLDCTVWCAECHWGFCCWLPLSQWCRALCPRSWEVNAAFSAEAPWPWHFCRWLPKKQAVSPSLLEHGHLPLEVASSQGDFWGPAHPDNSLLSHYLPTLTCQQHSQFHWIFSFYSETFTFYVFKSFYLYYFSLKLARMTVLFKFSIIWKTFSPPENYFCVTV